MALGFIVRRNDAVYAYRRRMLDAMRELRGDEFDRALRRYDSVRYDTMVWRFWRPLDSFYATAGSDAVARDPQGDSGPMAEA